MQTISALLKITGGAGTWSTQYNKRSSTPEIMVGVAGRLRFDLRTSAIGPDGILLPYPAAELQSDAFYFALDIDFLQETSPKLLISDHVTLTTTDKGETYLDAVLPNTATPEILKCLASKKTLSLHGEIGGYSGSNNADCANWAVGFELTLRNRVYIGGKVPPEVSSDPEYLTAAQVKALIAEATRSTTPGPAGTTPHIGGNGNWWIGETDTGVKAAGKDGEDAEPAQNGNDGKSAYQIAVDNGFTGTVTQWLEELKGEPGTGLQVNATGEPAELHTYDDEKAGFVFACSVVDDTAKTTTKYYYVKASDLEGDWCEPPLIDTTYLHTPEIRPLDPVPFKFEPKEYLQFSLKSYANAWLAAVTIDTADGELQLFPGTTGLKRVLRDKDGMLKIWFGSAVPAYETGKLYFTQFLGLADTGGTPDIETPDPEDPGSDVEIRYGYLTDPSLTSVTQITAAHLEQLSSVTAAALGKTSLGVVPAGYWPVVVVPEGYAAYKDDGLGGMVPFSIDNGAANTGANGVTISGVGKVYGEFKLASAEIFFYVRQV